MVPQRGEQCPVENNSYKGYSTPKCTCNAISHIQVKTYTFQLKCLHAMDENVTHHVPCPESSSTPSHMHMSSVKPVIYVPSMIIQNKSLLFYKSKSIGQTPIFTCFYQVPCVFVGSEFPGSQSRLCMPSNTFANFIAGCICLTKNTRFFTRWGIYPFLLYPTHVFFISFFFYATVRLILDIVPFYQAHHRTPNTVSISTMHSHPCHAMSCA